MCAHAGIVCCLVKLCDFRTTQYDMSDETVKQCLSHRYVMTLHKHTSQLNDEMRTHEWPQLVQDDVEHDEIYVMDEIICIHCKNSLQQKKKQKCLTRHVQMVCSYMASHRIYKIYCHWREEWFLHEFHS